MTYKSITQRKREEKQIALLWLYLCSKGLLTDFKQFYRLHQAQTLEQIDEEMKKLLNDKDNGK